MGRAIGCQQTAGGRSGKPTCKFGSKLHLEQLRLIGACAYIDAGDGMRTSLYMTLPLNVPSTAADGRLQREFRKAGCTAPIPALAVSYDERARRQQLTGGFRMPASPLHREPAFAIAGR